MGGGQVMPTARRVMYAAQLSSQKALPSRTSVPRGDPGPRGGTRWQL
jgi:hypothetical protein